MMRVVRKNAAPFATLIGLIVIGLVVGAYLIVNQGARLPFFSPSPIRIFADLDTAQAVTPGQGQSVQVAGVQIGKIATVTLKDGRARLGLDIEPKYIHDGLLRQHDTALLRPRTPLKDMYLQVLRDSNDPGAPVKKGFVIPVQNTLSDVNLDQIEGALDQRTRDYLVLLLNGTGKGLAGEGAGLAEVFKRFGPTVQDLGRVNRAVAEERGALRSTIHSLAGLNTKLAQRPQELTGLVSAANQTFGAFASEDGNLKEFVAELPATLRQATQTLGDVRPLANELGPATAALTPALQALQRANAKIRPFAKQATPILRTQIRPFTRASRPLVRDLAPAATNLSATFPDLLRSTTVLNHFFNMIGFNPNGREDPGTPGREEGYLFWLAWTAHQGANLISTDDANGPMRAVLPTGTCATLTSLVNMQPSLEFGMGLSGVLATACGNPTTTSVLPSKVARQLATAAKLRDASTTTKAKG